MKKIIYLLFIFLSSAKVFGQTNFDTERLFAVIAYISTQKVSTQNINGIDYEIFLKNTKTRELIPSTSFSSGTGFFVGKDLDFYLVTAQHVAKTTDINTIVTLRIDEVLPFKVPLKGLIGEKHLVHNQINWFYHESADVAAVPLDKELITKHKIASLPYSLLNNKLEAPRRITNLTVYGHPFGLGEDKMNSPVSKKFNAASDIIELPRFDNGVITKFFLLDDPSLSGYSGGPVIHIPDFYPGIIPNPYDKYSILGLVHGSLNDKQGGGHGAVVPSKFIIETIDQIPAYTGKYVYRYTDGKIWSEVIYKNGNAWTVLSNNDKNGKPLEKGTLLEGNGTRFVYDENSRLVYVEYFENGTVVNTEPR